MIIRRSSFPWVAASAIALAETACSGRSSVVELGPVTTLASAGASNPTAAVDPRSGAVYVAWVQTNDGVSNVYLAQAEGPGKSFSTPVRVNHLPGDAAPHEQAPAQVAVGPEGNVYVVWQKTTPVEGRRFPASGLRFARSTDGGRSFDPAITVNDDVGGPPASHTFHNIAVGPDGTVYISWLDSRTRASLGNGLGGLDEAGSHLHPMRNSSPGDELDAAGPEVRVARSVDAGQSFDSSVVVDRSACPCCRTALAVSREGTVYVAWRKVFDGNVRDIVVARSDDRARTFSVPFRVHHDDWVFPGCPHAGPGLAVDEAGAVHVAWYTGAEGAAGLYYTVADHWETGFREPEQLVEDPVAVSQVKLASVPGGVLGVWEDRRGEESRVILGRVRAFSGLGDRAQGVGTGTSPAVAAGGGVYVVAWLEGQAVRVRLAADEAFSSGR